jgi:hypothetical protein
VSGDDCVPPGVGVYALFVLGARAVGQRALEPSGCAWDQSLQDIGFLEGRTGVFRRERNRLGLRGDMVVGVLSGALQTGGRNTGCVWSVTCNHTGLNGFIQLSIKSLFVRCCYRGAGRPGGDVDPAFASVVN